MKFVLIMNFCFIQDIGPLENYVNITQKIYSFFQERPVICQFPIKNNILEV